METEIDWLGLRPAVDVRAAARMREWWLERFDRTELAEIVMMIWG